MPMDRPSVCPSVTLRLWSYWVSWKIITLYFGQGLRFNIINLIQWEQPQFSGEIGVGYGKVVITRHDKAKVTTGRLHIHKVVYEVSISE